MSYKIFRKERLKNFKEMYRAFNGVMEEKKLDIETRIEATKLIVQTMAEHFIYDEKRAIEGKVNK